MRASRNLPLLLCSLLLVAFSVPGHASVITSVFPTEGPVTGGTVVRIHGSGFAPGCSNCAPPTTVPLVYFAGTRSPSVTYIDSNTIEAVTPHHLPGPVHLKIIEDGSLGQEELTILLNAFTFVGEAEEAFDPVLFPIFMPPIDGAFGARFETKASVWNQTPGSSIMLYGLDTSCYLFTPIRTALDPHLVNSNGLGQTLLTGCAPSTGRLFWMPKGSGKLAANLRVGDVTRQAESHGVEIPVVPKDRFSEERITLLDIPVDPRYRHTLRIYSLRHAGAAVNVSVNGQFYRKLPLLGGMDRFDPTFAVLTEFPSLPAGQTSMLITIDTAGDYEGEILPAFSIWAFMSITNNDTQQITTVTPQP
jgi:hypothetical protein